MMKAKWITMAMVFLVGMLFLGGSAAIAANGIDEPANLGLAADPPDGAMVTMIPTGDGGVLISVKGMEVYNDLVYLYGDPDGIKTTKLSEDGTAKIPARHWANLIFKGADGLWHYLHMSDENQVVLKTWMGPGVCVMPDFGYGSSMVYCGWVRPSYLGQK